jgi:hypothetical protein
VNGGSPSKVSVSPRAGTDVEMKEVAALILPDSFSGVRGDARQVFSSSV